MQSVSRLQDDKRRLQVALQEHEGQSIKLQREWPVTYLGLRGIAHVLSNCYMYMELEQSTLAISNSKKCCREHSITYFRTFCNISLSLAYIFPKDSYIIYIFGEEKRLISHVLLSSTEAGNY